MVRKMFYQMYSHIDKKPYSILIGARQTGKSTLLRQLREKLAGEGKKTVFRNCSAGLRSKCADLLNSYYLFTVPKGDKFTDFLNIT